MTPQELFNHKKRLSAIADEATSGMLMLDDPETDEKTKEIILLTLESIELHIQVIKIGLGVTEEERP